MQSNIRYPDSDISPDDDQTTDAPCIPPDTVRKLGRSRRTRKKACLPRTSIAPKLFGFRPSPNDQSNICFRREIHMLQHHRARYRHIALSGLFDISGLRRRPTGHADSSGVAGGEGSSTMACIIPSADHGSVVSRMGITKRISLNGALGGSGGSIVNSMKSLRARSCKSDPCAPPRQVCCAP